MLILSRKPGETVVIDGRIRVKVIRVEGDVVKIGIDAPAEVSVHREEVYDEIQRNNKEAATPDALTVPRISRPNKFNKEERNLTVLK
jgi:carbon storage regulator